MRLLWAAVCQNHLSLQCGKGRGPQSRFRVFIYSSYYQRGHDQRPPKTIPSLTTSTQQMILRREDSPRLQLQHSHLKSRRRHVSSCYSSRQRNLRRRPPRLRRSSPADDSTNIVDIIITFASSCCFWRRNTVALPSTILTLLSSPPPRSPPPRSTPPRSPPPRSSLMMAQSS